MLTRRLFAGTLAAAAIARPARASALNDDFRALLGEDDDAYFAAIARLRARGGADLAPALIICARFAKWHDEPIFDLLSKITGADHRSWFDWMIWQQRNPDLRPHPGYVDFKREVFYRLDPRFARFIGEGRLENARIRFEEVTWGGVRVDGIEALNAPKMVRAIDADFMLGSDPVLGIEVNGDARAYPLRLMAWHEMVNDTVGGEAIALPFCTLCGAGVPYRAKVDDGAPLRFGTSGLLYRANKLMWDDRTESLWNQFNGEPVIGPLVGSGLKLEALPLVMEPWVRWRERHPETLVLSLDTGKPFNYGSGYVYDRYIRTDAQIFPVAHEGERLRSKDFVFGVKTLGGARAWPVTAFEGGRAINDAVGALNLVLIGDRLGETVRAYDRGDRTFQMRDGRVFADGAEWRVTEDALIAPSGARAPRVAGRTAYWFAWSSFEGPGASLWNDR
ncbi:MAG: DUF3179 domain-containing protein [Pseudomonadota bacterium]